ncbi:MAG: hypothetical protein V1743_05795 [Nanoarchaeota archaeon]
MKKMSIKPPKAPDFKPPSLPKAKLQPKKEESSPVPQLMSSQMQEASPPRISPATDSPASVPVQESAPDALIAQEHSVPLPPPGMTKQQPTERKGGFFKRLFRRVPHRPEDIAVPVQKISPAYSQPQPSPPPASMLDLVQNTNRDLSTQQDFLKFDVDKPPQKIMRAEGDEETTLDFETEVLQQPKNDLDAHPEEILAPPKLEELDDELQQGLSALRKKLGLEPKAELEIPPEDKLDLSESITQEKETFRPDQVEEIRIAAPELEDQEVSIFTAKPPEEIPFSVQPQKPIIAQEKPIPEPAPIEQEAVPQQEKSVQNPVKEKQKFDAEGRTDWTAEVKDIEAKKGEKPAPAEDKPVQAASQPLVPEPPRELNQEKKKQGFIFGIAGKFKKMPDQKPMMTVEKVVTPKAMPDVSGLVSPAAALSSLLKMRELDIDKIPELPLPEKKPVVETIEEKLIQAAQMKTRQELAHEKLKEQVMPLLEVRPLSEEEVKQIVNTLNKEDKQFEKYYATFEQFILSLQEEFRQIARSPFSYRHLIGDKEELKQKTRKLEAGLSDDSGKCLVLKNGKKVYSCADLYTALSKSPDDLFKYHVSAGKNDFANWISGSLNKKAAAAQLRKAKGKPEFLSLLKRLAEKESRARAGKQNALAELKERLCWIEEKEAKLKEYNIPLFLKLHEASSLGSMAKLLKTIEFVFKVDMDDIIIASGDEFTAWLKRYLNNERIAKQVDLETLKHDLEILLDRSGQKLQFQIEQKEKELLQVYDKSRQEKAGLEMQRKNDQAEKEQFLTEKNSFDQMLSKKKAALENAFADLREKLKKEHAAKLEELRREKENFKKLRIKQDLDIFAEIQKLERWKQKLASQQLDLEEDRKEFGVKKKTLLAEKEKQLKEMADKVAALRKEHSMLTKKRADEEKRLAGLEEEHKKHVKKDPDLHYSTPDKNQAGFEKYPQAETVQEIRHAASQKFYDESEQIKQLVKQGDIEGAKTAYNNLREEFIAAELAEGERPVLHNLLRTLYDDIHLASLKQ